MKAVYRVFIALWREVSDLDTTGMVCQCDMNKNISMIRSIILYKPMFSAAARPTLRDAVQQLLSPPQINTCALCVVFFDVVKSNIM